MTLVLIPVGNPQSNTVKCFYSGEAKTCVKRLKKKFFEREREKKNI